MLHPLPNDQILGGTVVASVIYREADDELPEDRYTIILMMPQPDYYKVGVIVDQGDMFAWEFFIGHANIGPAVEEYADCGGDW